MPALDKTKRVLILSLAYYPHVGGAEIALNEITDRISDIEFYMITLRFGREPREERLGNVLVHRVGWGGAYVSKILFVPLAALRARSLHRAQPFDALWAMMTYMVFPVVLLRVLGTRIPYALTLQDGDPFEHVFHRWFIRPFAPLLRYGVRNANVVQTISNFLAGWVRALEYKGPVEVVPNGVDVRRFAGEKIPHPDTVLITVSRLVHKNAVDDLIRAVALLPQGVTLRILGTGSEEAMLHKLARELGVAARVEFAGFVAHAQLPAVLHAADIFVRSSRSEGMGNSFIEAMAAGVPVIGTKVGGIPDFLIDGETGLFCEVNNPQSIAEKVMEYINNSERTDKIVENAQKLVRENYDWNLIAGKMKEAFDGLIL